MPDPYGLTQVCVIAAARHACPLRAGAGLRNRRGEACLARCVARRGIVLAGIAVGFDLNQTTDIGFPAIAHAVHGADKGLVGVERLQLAAQIFNMAVDGAVGHHAIIVVQVV